MEEVGTSYGPWIMVEQKFKRGRSDLRGANDKTIGTTSTGSRFSTLNDLGETTCVNSLYIGHFTKKKKKPFLKLFTEIG